MGGKKHFDLMLEIGHKSQPLKNKLPNGYTHKWTVFVKGADNAKIEHCIQRVVFQLHESFSNPHREITQPPFQVKETGYAGFEIPIEIYFKNRDKPNHLVFVLDLMLLTDRPNSAIKNQKVSFFHPNREFEKCLIKTGAQMILMSKDKKERSDSPPVKKQKTSSLIPSKDMSKQAAPTQSHSQTAPSINSQSSATTSSHQNNSSQHHHHKSSHQSHHHGYHGHSNNSSSQTNHISGGNAPSNTGGNNNFQNHHNNHQSNHSNNHHSSSKTSNHQPNSLPKQKTTSKEFLDVFGAPLVINNSNGGTGTSNKGIKTHSGRDVPDSNGDVPFFINESPPPNLPRITHKTAQTGVAQTHTGSKSSHSRSHHKHHHVKSEPTQTPTNPQVATPPTPQIIRQKIVPQDSFQAIQDKISTLTDNDRLQKIVDIIEEAGEWYNLTSNKFEFDLKRLDKKTLYKIEKSLNL